MEQVPEDTAVFCILTNKLAEVTYMGKESEVHIFLI